MSVQSDPSSKKFKDQSFEEIVGDEDLGDGTWWVDPEFPPDNTSLFQEPRQYEIEWRRPWQIRGDACVCVDGYAVGDVHQGKLGNCWFVASIAAVAEHPSLFEKVMPPGQTFLPSEGYRGCFLFRFWRFGEWVEVVIDDLLPTIDNRLVYMRSKPENEFWTCLVEKAYAKLNGSYEALNGGYSRDAMVDLTGGACIYYNFMEDEIKGKEGLQGTVKKDVKKSFTKDQAVMCCSTANVDHVALETQLSNGLVTGHVYSVIAAHTTTQGALLMKVRNPWGRTEWSGAWSDDSVLWETLSAEDEAIMKPDFGDDGIFWIDFEEFLSEFEDVTMCRVGYYAFQAAADQLKRWFTSEIRGKWDAGVTAGGCSNYLDTFWSNPQYMFDISDEADDAVQIILCQPDGRAEGDGNWTIGFIILQVQDDENERVVWKDIKSLAPRTKFSDVRQVRLSCDLEVGRYVIIPSTYEPDQESEFLLRVFSEKDARLCELQSNVVED